MCSNVFSGVLSVDPVSFFFVFLILIGIHIQMCSNVFSGVPPVDVVSVFFVFLILLH